jgi:hypothetical protein
MSVRSLRESASKALPNASHAGRPVLSCALIPPQHNLGQFLQFFNIIPLGRHAVASK